MSRSSLQTRLRMLSLILTFPLVQLFGCQELWQLFSPAPPVSASLTSQPSAELLPVPTAAEYEEHRLQTIGEASKVFAESPGTLTEKQAALVAFLSQQIDFTAVGIEGTDVWAHYRDGALVIFADSFDFSESANDTSGVPRPIPSSEGIYSGSTLGTCYSSTADVIATQLAGRGYKTSALTPIDASVDILKSLSDPLGIFYIHSHGARVIDKNSNLEYAVASSTDVSTSRSIEYSEDLREGRLAFMVVAHDRVSEEKPGCTVRYRYGFTSKFVKKYIKFASGSFSFVNACSSSSEQAESFVNAFLNNGCESYVGWTAIVGDRVAARAARFLFDRVLAINGSAPDLFPESAPQRPFGIRSIVQDMGVIDPPRRPFRLDYYKPTSAFLTTTLKTGSVETFALPSIAGMSIADYEYACTNSAGWTPYTRIKGQFGSEAGQVFISSNADLTGGVEVPVYSWGETQISLRLLAADGSGSVGHLWVQIGARKSNVVQITRWTINFQGEEYYDLSGNQFPPAGEGRIEINTSVNILGCLNKFREAPHGASHDNMNDSDLFLIGYTIGLVSGTGSTTRTYNPDPGDGQNHLLSQSIELIGGSIPVNSCSTSGTGVLATARLVEESTDSERKMRLKFRINAPMQKRYTSNYEDGQTSIIDQMVVSRFPASCHSYSPPWPGPADRCDLGLGLFTLEMTSDFRIVGGALVFDGLPEASSDPGRPTRGIVTWPNVVPEFPPLPNAPQ